MISEARNAHSSPERGSASIAAMCTCVQRYHQLHNPCGQTPSLVPVCVVVAVVKSVLLFGYHKTIKGCSQVFWSNFFICKKQQKKRHKEVLSCRIQM